MIIVSATKSGYIKISAKKKITPIGEVINFRLSTNIALIKDIWNNQNYQRKTYKNNNSF